MDALTAARQHVERHGTADQRNWLRIAEAHQAILHGRWNAAAEMLEARIAEAEAGLVHYLDPTCHAFTRARETKDPQITAPALALCATVLLTQGRRKQASTLTSEVLACGHVQVAALLELHGAVTPIEFAWLVRDLGREAELLTALESAPPTPWLQAACAIAEHDSAGSLDLVAKIRAPSVDAYARLRAAEEAARSGSHDVAKELLAPALQFFRRVLAARHLAIADGLLAEGT